MTTSLKQLYGKGGSGSAPIGTVITSNGVRITDESYIPASADTILLKADYPELAAALGNIPYAHSQYNVDYIPLKDNGLVAVKDIASTSTTVIAICSNNQIIYGTDGSNNDIASPGAFADISFLSNCNSKVFGSSGLDSFDVTSPSTAVALGGATKIPSTRWIYQNSGYWSYHCNTFGTLTIVGGTTIGSFAVRLNYDISSSDGFPSYIFPISTDRIGVIVQGNTLTVAKVLIFTVAGNVATFSEAVDTDLIKVDATGAIGWVTNTLFMYGIKTANALYAMHTATSTSPAVWTETTSTALPKSVYPHVVGKYYKSSASNLVFNTSTMYCTSLTPTVDSSWHVKIHPNGVKGHPSINKAFMMHADNTNIRTFEFQTSNANLICKYGSYNSGDWTTGTANAVGSGSNGASIRHSPYICSDEVSVIMILNESSNNTVTRSLDGGRSFHSISVIGSCYWIKYHAGTWLFGGTAGIYRSTDNGTTLSLATYASTAISAPQSYPAVHDGVRWIVNSTNGAFSSPTGAVWTISTSSLGKHGGLTSNSSIITIASNTTTNVSVRLMPDFSLQYTLDGDLWRKCNMSHEAALSSHFLACISGTFYLKGNRDSYWYMQSSDNGIDFTVAKLTSSNSHNNGVFVVDGMLYADHVCYLQLFDNTAGRTFKFDKLSGGYMYGLSTFGDDLITTVGGGVTIVRNRYGYNPATHFCLPGHNGNSYIKAK